MQNCNTAGSNFRPYKNMDSFFNQSFNNFWSNDMLNEVPPHNIKSSEGNYVIELSAPGLDKSNFVISVEDNTLTIKVDKKKVVDAQDLSGPQYLKKEFSYNNFTRRFQLDKTISSDNINAAYENGILSVILTKVNKADTLKKIDIV